VTGRTELEPAVGELALRLGDDALVLGHRLSEWCGHAPMLEEDIALSNLGLDLIGQARLYYSYAAEVEGKGRDEDKLAYFRDASAYSNCLLVEQPNGDFAVTMARQLLYAAYAHPYAKALMHSADSRLAEIGAKSAKEMAYHVRHSGEWVIRLGDSTEEARRRIVEALDDLWGYTGELFEMDATEHTLVKAGITPDRALIRTSWDQTIDHVLREATLDRPRDRHMQSGGRRGQHTEFLGKMLAEMQVLARAHPDAKW
jgi:ring-1,2-phenylacetyl-CoA epoxidase subunit PaaC